ncbi:MAG: hypothetical protein Q7K57_12230 [Burkholderiaceae bacterium]|nr:hypothetical protein [Burkholderiaceae bacterium]
MGMEDRDLYREMQLARLKKTQFFKRKSTPWLVIVSFWVVVLLLLFQAAKYLPSYVRSFPFSSRSAPAAPIQSVAPVQQINKQPEIHQVEAPTTQPDPAPIIQKQQQGSVTIYLCKAYSGGIFWSSAYCGTQQALIDRTATVPGSLPFDQQVQIAEAQRAAALPLYNQKSVAVVSASERCAALKKEREIIEARYSNWKWQPLEVINPDQNRMRGLRSEQQQLKCSDQ